MNFTDDQKIVQELANKVAKQELEPKAREVDTAQLFPREGMQKLARAGFLDTVPEAMGGEGKDALSFVLVA